jgi:hypothetical protein
MGPAVETFLLDAPEAVAWEPDFVRPAARFLFPCARDGRLTVLIGTGDDSCATAEEQDGLTVVIIVQETSFG